ncbi:MAG: hypothetical protein ACREBU_16220 [Nitrososphaera sp.]
MEVLDDSNKSDCKGSRGGGSRYGKNKEAQDLSAEENKFCGCWLHQEERRRNNASWLCRSRSVAA